VAQRPVVEVQIHEVLIPAAGREFGAVIHRWRQHRHSALRFLGFTHYRINHELGLEVFVLLGVIFMLHVTTIAS